MRFADAVFGQADTAQLLYLSFLASTPARLSEKRILTNQTLRFVIIVHDEDIAAIKADLAQMKAEYAQARADRKTKIQEKIDQLNSKLQAQLQKAKDQRQAAERDAQLKLDALKEKAKGAAAKAGA